MEKQDLELIESNRKTNYKLDKLWVEHEELEGAIEKLEAIKVPTPAEDKKLTAFKKKKLEGRDKIEKILQTLR